MAELSPGMEARLRKDEDAARIKQTIRHRQRYVPCLMPDCTERVARATEIRLCNGHLFNIWRYVDQLGSHRVEPYVFDGSPLPEEPILTLEEQELRRQALRDRARRVAHQHGMLYVMDTSDGWLKIGWTGRRFLGRINQYPPNFRFVVAVPGTRADERDAHRALKPSRIAGREWYDPTPEVVRQVNEWIARANMLKKQIETDVIATTTNPEDLAEGPLIERYEPKVYRSDAQREMARHAAHSIETRHPRIA